MPVVSAHVSEHRHKESQDFDDSCSVTSSHLERQMQIAENEIEADTLELALKRKHIALEKVKLQLSERGSNGSRRSTGSARETCPVSVPVSAIGIDKESAGATPITLSPPRRKALEPELDRINEAE